MAQNVKQSNSAAMNILSEQEIKQQLKRAFADDNKGRDLVGSAEQRAAFAITAEHAALNDKGENLPPLAELLTSTEALSTIRNAIYAAFGIAAPKKDKDEAHTQKFSDMKDDYAKQNQLMTRAFKTAGIAAKLGLPLTAWDLNTGVLSVPGRSLCKADEMPFGRLNGTVALNNKAVMATLTGDSEGIRTFRTSCERFRQINAPVVRRAQTDKPQAGKALLKSLKDTVAILTSDDKPVALSELDDDIRNNITAIVAWYDKATEAEKAKAKPKAKAA